MAVQLFHVGIKALCRDDQGRYLLLQVNPDKLKGKVNPAYWDIPGGRIEEGDTVEATLSREVREELGIVFETKPEFFTGVVSNISIPTDTGEVGLVLMIYSVLLPSGAQIKISDEHIAYEWVDDVVAAERLQFKYPEEFTERLK